LFGISVLLFYFYPNSKAKERKRSIDTNLSFAIDHMSAVSNSGVPPTAMFKLFSRTKEYGVISGEIKKIVNLVEFYGKDLLSAIRKVAARTPSEYFKEFLNGFSSNIESGGDINKYLHEKSTESKVMYKLVSKKYLNIVSLYSDIYTGVLLVAPIFLIILFTLFSVIRGGNILGMDIKTLIITTVYVIIPVINIGFIFFLESSQSSM
ncbi:type II secretion system F family protein, partial [Nanoarchaeota archaeon]